jgi:hypothetical protein
LIRPVEHLTVACDPSVNSAGLALFDGDGLFYAARVRGVLDASHDLGARWASMSLLIWDAVRSRVPQHVASVSVAYERPQTYRPTKSKGDANDLHGLAAIGNGLAVLARWSWSAHDVRVEVTSYTPQEWTGCTSKDTRGPAWENPRAERIRVRLSPDELALVPAQHDVIDAVGIGLHALGRFARRRVYASG